MKLFTKTPQQKKRRIPFARRFVSVDGERTFFVEQVQVPPPLDISSPPPTIACSDDSPFRSLLTCGGGGGDMDQIIIQEPATIQVEAPKGTMQQLFDRYSKAIQTALLLDDDDEEEVEDDSIDYDLQNRLNTSDTVLMEGEAGVLRLTQEGLKRHEQKTFCKDSFHDTTAASSGLPVGLAAFRQEQARKQRQKERDQETLLRSNNVSSPEQSPVQVVDKTPQENKGLFARFSLRKSDKNVVDSTPKQQAMSDREQARIAFMRQQELERQCKREAQAKRNLPSKIMNADETGLANEAGIEVMNEPMLNKNKNTKRRNSAPAATMQAKLSTSVKDSPCVVCNMQERTHIAVPCMHFSFCETCAKNLSRNQWDCPVCSTPYTTYNQVFA